LGDQGIGNAVAFAEGNYSVVGRPLHYSLQEVVGTEVDAGVIAHCCFVVVVAVLVVVTDSLVHKAVDYTPLVV
jgi:hypothetical protein